MGVGGLCRVPTNHNNRPVAMAQLIYLELQNNISFAATIYYKSPIEAFRSRCFVRIPMLKSRGKLNLRLLRVVLTKVFGGKKYY